MIRSPFSSSVKISSCRSSRLSSRCENISWEQAAHALGAENAIHADGHRRGAMGNFMFLRAPDHLRKGMLEDAEEFVGHLRFAPAKRLQTLHPLEIGNDHAAGIAENIGNHNHFIPALLENPVRVGRGRT